MESDPAGNDKKQKKPTDREENIEGMQIRDNGNELGKRS